MVNCPLFGISIPRPLSKFYERHKHQVAPALQTTLQELLSSAPANLVPSSEISQLSQNAEVFVEDLKRELKTLSENLQAAWSQDRLDEFFDATAHNTSPFEKHSLALVQITADSALVTAQKVLKSVRETGYQGRRLYKSSPSVRAPIVSGNVTGGIGAQEAPPRPAARVAKPRAPT
ncbi:hypothetical protein B0H14DRAFT_3889802 [Mycena olivaceomarginata]|nr:hypothetical protein B0H14DRAFT_3889802 [Mycena olivaceomarginata]